MVRITYSKGPPARCVASLPAPRPAAAHWEEVEQALQARLRLPAFSVRDTKQPSDLEPHALFKRFAAALPLDTGTDSEWARSAALHPLSSLRGPADEVHLQLRPQLLDLPSPKAQAGAVPSFLLRGRMPLTEDWQRRAGATVDPPCLPSACSAADLEQAVALSAIIQGCQVEPQQPPPLPALDRQKYTFQPQLIPEQAAAAQAAPTKGGLKQFDLLNCLLKQAPPVPAATAAPRLLDVPVLPCAGQDAGSGPLEVYLRLDQLAAATADADSLVGTACDEGFVSLSALADSSDSKALQHLVAPALMQVPGPAPPLAAVPSFLLRLAPAEASTPDPSTHFFSLEAPVLPSACTSAAAGPTLGAPINAFGDLFEPLPVPEVLAVPMRFAPVGCEPVSLASLAAQDMVLDDGGLVLPAVVFEDEGGSEAESVPPLLSLIRSECGCKPVSTAHLALYLDWSLSTKHAANRPAELVAAMRDMRQQMMPKQLPTAAGEDQQEAKRRAQLIQQLLAPFQHSSKAQRPASGAVPAVRVDVQASSHLEHLPLAAQLAQPQQQQQQQQAAERAATTAAGAAAAQDGQPPAKRTKHGKGAAGDMHYFLQLQQRGGGAARDGGAGSAATPAAVVSAAAAQGATTSTDDEDTAEALELYQSRASTSVHTVELPASHVELLQLLRADEQRLVRAAPAPGVAPEVTRSDFLSVDVLQRALEQAAGKPGQRDLLKVYAAMAVVRQTAASLVHHGIRCAHLYFTQSQAELPGLLNPVTAARELRQAYQQVERGALEDSPKHAALQRLLGGLATLSPGSKLCVIGDPKSFFTLYKVVLAAGQHVCHFDRDGRLLASGASAEQLEAAVRQACASAGCVLVAAELVARGGFPLGAFQQVVVYASEQDVSRAGLQGQLMPLACPKHFLEMVLPAAVQQQGLPRAPAAAQQAPGGMQQAQGAAEVARVQHAARPAAAARQGAAAAVTAAGAAAASCSKEWPVIISSDPCRPIRSRRLLYEAVLAVEREGGAVLERPLTLVDAVLSPSAALVICDNSSSRLEFEAFLAALEPVLSRLSYAFSKVVLICEGSAGFQAQVLCGTDRLLALGRSHGLQLQCHATTSGEATAAVVAAVMHAWLARWQAVEDPGLQYSVPDAPTEEEAFLTRFYSINPHSAALLMSLGLSLRQLLHLDALNPLQLPKALSILPRHSLELFVKSASHGTPLLGIPPTASVMHAHQQQQVSMAVPAAASPPQRYVDRPSARDGLMSPGQGSTMPHRWQQQHPQHLQYPAAYPHVAVTGQQQLHGAAFRGLQQSHMLHLQEQAGQQHPAAAVAGYQPRGGQANQPHGIGLASDAYLTAHLERLPEQQERWGGSSEPLVQMNEAVYHRGMQLMQARLRSQPGAAGQVLPQHQGTAGWLGPEQAAPALAGQGQAHAHSSASAERAAQQEELLQHQQQYQQQLQLYQQQQLLQQQAQAEAFPEIDASPPEWDGVQHPAAGARSAWPNQQQHLPQHQHYHQSAPTRQQLPGMPPLPARVGRMGLADCQPAAVALGSSVPFAQQPQYAGQVAGRGAAGWAAQQQGASWQLQQQQHVDEFGVSMQPSMSDDESENAGTRLLTPGGQGQVLHQQLQLPGQSSAGRAALAAAGLYGPQQAAVGADASAYALAGADLHAGSGGNGAAGGGDSLMDAFLSSRKRDFTVPRMAKPAAGGSRQVTPQHMRGAGALMAAQEPADGVDFGEEEGDLAPAAKRHRGAAAVAASGGGFTNMLRPAGGSTGQGAYKRQGGGRWGGGGGRRGGGGWKGGYKSNKPSRAW